MSHHTPGRHALRRPNRTPRRRVVALVVGVVVVVVLVIAIGGHDSVSGRAVPVPRPPEPGWSTLIDPDSGLSYRIPPTGWTTNPTVGTAGSVTLTQGALLPAYTCGNPIERLQRGILGSGSAPRTDPAALADAVATAAANQYYRSGATAPTVKLDPAQPVRRQTGKGTTLTGVLVRATVTQHTDACLASEGEVLVFVLQFSDHDGVLVVNGDLAGGPASPAPATDASLRAIVDTAQPT
ncbi:MAG TPA: hypothetical protein VH352_03975 [Pseudonocardiaceae bacterium]|nr:hypothetical protein [Pseudonocardiaceae bacterium]